MLKSIATGLIVFGVAAITFQNGTVVDKQEKNIGSARLKLIEKYKISPSAARSEVVSAVRRCISEETSEKVSPYLFGFLVDTVELSIIFLGANNIESTTDPRAVKFFEQSQKSMASKALNVAKQLSHEPADVQKRSEKLVKNLKNGHKFDRCVVQELWSTSTPKG
jgi:chorismate mutase